MQVLGELKSFFFCQIRTFRIQNPLKYREYIKLIWIWMEHLFHSNLIYLCCTLGYHKSNRSKLRISKDVNLTEFDRTSCPVFLSPSGLVLSVGMIRRIFHFAMPCLKLCWTFIIKFLYRVVQKIIYDFWGMKEEAKMNNFFYVPKCMYIDCFVTRDPNKVNW